MELEDQEFNYLCKFCNKSFPCGRSLGGHMRSHLSNNSAEEDEKLIVTRVKLSSADNKVNSDFETPHQQPDYGLRGNPRKTWRLADSSEDTSLLPNMLCRECGKGYSSWKALFGHMKRHSAKERVNSMNSFGEEGEEEEEDSWTCAKQQLVMMDSQSDNETTTTAPNRRRRSRRRRTRYMGTTTSSSNFSIANAAAAATTTSSVTETEQEQEEVATCLMMLSRDVGSHSGGLKFLTHHDSSDNNSVFSDSPSPVKTAQVNADIKGKISVSGGAEALKLKKKLDKKTLVVGNLDSLLLGGRQSQMKEEGLSVGGFSRNDKLVKKMELVEVQLGSNKKKNSSKRMFQEACDVELRRPDRATKTVSASRTGALDSEVVYKSSQKRSKFECTTCNKVFRSYQALGGHRASHKKIRGCFASKTEGCKNTIESDLSPDPTSDSKLSESCNHDNPIENDIAASAVHDVKAEITSAKSKGHACPICLKVFPSGQALGGHKRSHLIGGSAAETRTNPTLVIQKPAAPEVRDFLDLNLPAPVEEDSSSSHAAAAAAFKPWWVGSSHKHEALVGLISN